MKKSSPIIATSEPVNILKKDKPRFCGMQVRRETAIPIRIKSKAVLGAIGIRFVPKLVKSGIFKIHPSIARNPIAAVTIPAVTTEIVPA
jgi:hypothetical protein